MNSHKILETETAIVAVLKGIYDPEIPVNIYDLGLIYEIDYEPSGKVHILMTLTAPNCPVADSLVDQVKAAVRGVEGVEEVDLELVFDPPWDKTMLSEEAKLELGLL